MSDTPVLGYVLKGYPRLSETFISNEILLLEEMGVKMHLFSMRHPREKICHPSVEKIGAGVTYLPTELLDDFPRLVVANISLAGRHPERYKKALLYAAALFREKGKVATIKHFLQAGFLVNTMEEKGLNVQQLHGHFAHSPTSVTLFASMLADIPFSFTAHAKDIYTSSPAALREKMERAAFVATCTKYNDLYLTDLRGEISCPIHTIYHGINLSLFHNENSGLPPQPPYKILTVARLTEKKGLPTLFQALKILKERGIAFEHQLIGDGDDRESVLAYIRELGLEEQCHWLGACTHTEVLAEFSRSHLFALSCKIAANGDRDGVPNVLVESLAMGVPAISTTVSAIPELLHHGKTGYLVEPDQPMALADGIERMLTDLPLRKNIIEQGRLFVEEYFDNRVQTQKLREVFLQDNPALQGGELFA